MTGVQAVSGEAVTGSVCFVGLPSGCQFRVVVTRSGWSM